MKNLPDSVKLVKKPLDAVIPAFERITAAYSRDWGLICSLVDVEGRLVAGGIRCSRDCADGPDCAAACRRAIEESVRWGEPSVLLCPKSQMIWAVPVMENAHVVGGLIAARMEPGYEPATPAPELVHQAMADLLRVASEANLTNAALLEHRRREARRESERAEAIHEVKGHNYQSIRDIYLVEEPALIAATKRGDRASARDIINRVLVGIYFVGRDRPVLLKSLILELVVMMSRSAVEAGGDPNEVLGSNYSSVADLARIETEEELCIWLVEILERIMGAIKANHRYPIGVLLDAAISYMRENLQEDLSRDDVAKIACLSPSHFSRVIKQTYGSSFTELMAKMRVDRARELLVRTEKGLVQIGLDCGFREQSYFTKVFQKYTGASPGEYRKLHRPSIR